MAMWVHSMGGSSVLPMDAVGPALIAVLAAWSPSPISIPALIMQDVRDASLAGMTGLAGSLLRGIIITPWLAMSKESPVRVEMLASLLGFVVALFYVLAG